MSISLDGFEEAEKQPERHLSYSQVSAYVRCPLTYYWRYVKGIKTAPAGAMALGSSLHKAFEHNYSQKIYSHKDLPMSVVLDVFRDAWKENSRGCSYDPEKSENADSMLADGLMMVEKYHAEVSPKIQPKLIEARVTLNIPGISREILMFIDLVDDKDVVVDHKTSKATPNALTLAKDFQLVLYRMGFRAKFGYNPKGLRYDYIVRKASKKTGSWVEIHPMPVEKNETHEAALIAHFKTVLRCIKLCQFHNPDQFSFICTPSGCGFWDKCQGCVMRGERPDFLDEIREMQDAALRRVADGEAI